MTKKYNVGGKCFLLNEDDAKRLGATEWEAANPKKAEPKKPTTEKKEAKA